LFFSQDPRGPLRKIPRVTDPPEAPRGQAPPDRAAAESSYRRGQESFNRRSRESNEAAILCFRQAIEQDPTYAPAYAALAAAYCEAMIRYGHPRSLVDAAIGLTEKSVELDPGLLAGYDALAFAHFARGDLRKSLEAQYKVHVLDAAYPDAIANIAYLHLDLGELDLAVEWNRRALAAESPAVESPARRGLAYVCRNFGRLDLMFEEDAEAEAWLRKAVTLQPDFSSARVLLVYLHYRRGSGVRTQGEAHALLEARPDDPETLNYAADVALLRGNLAEARRLFEHAIALGPDSRNFYRARRAKTGLGFVLWQQGDPAAAQSLLDERIAIRTKEDEEGLNAWGPAYELAAIHAVLGRRPEALTWLRRAVERGWREAHLAEIDVMLQTLSGDPEYERILRDVRRQVAQMKVRAGKIGLPQ